MPQSQGWITRLPLKVRYQRSKLYISVIPVVALGFLVGILASIASSLRALRRICATASSPET